jgi:uncharacterized membrane protein YhaH (DUF805 family)
VITEPLPPKRGFTNAELGWRAGQRRGHLSIAMPSTHVRGLTAWIIWSWSEVGDGVRGALNSTSLRSVTDSSSGVAVLILLIVALLCVNLTLTVRRFVSDKQSK